MNINKMTKEELELLSFTDIAYEILKKGSEFMKINYLEFNYDDKEKINSKKYETSKNDYSQAHGNGNSIGYGFMFVRCFV